MSKHYDFIVVGGGVSGLLSTLVISRHGKKVLLIEKNENVGNNCNSYKVDGYQVDTGPHAITQLLKGGPLSYLIENYFSYTPVFVDYGDYFIRDKGTLKEVPTTLKDYLLMDLLPKKDRLVLAQSLTKMLLKWQIDNNISNVSVQDCLPWNSLSPESQDFMNTFSYFLSGKPAKETSVQRMFVGNGFIVENIDNDIKKTNESTPIFNSKFRKLSSIAKLLNNNKVDYNQYYPRDGLQAILKAILYSLPNNVDIKTKTPLKQIIVENNIVKGIITPEETYFTDNVVYSAFAKDLPLYVENLPSDYVADLKRIKQSISLTIWMGIDDTFDDFDYKGGEVWFRSKPFWAMPISNYNKSFAPEGKKLVGFMFSIDNLEQLESEKKEAYNTILKVYPNIDNYIDMVHYQVSIPEKASVSIDGYIAGTATPIDNLYLVGTDVDERSMGITRASYSVIKLINILNKKSSL